MLTTSVYAQVHTQIYVFLLLVATELQNKIQHYLNNCRHISQVFRPAGRGTYRRVHGEVVIIIRGWSLLLFIGAANCALLRSVAFRKCDLNCNRSHNDPAHLGNVCSIEANPLYSPYIVFSGDRLLWP